MDNERRKPMRAITVLGLAVLSALALSAVTASTASAVSLQLIKPASYPVSFTVSSGSFSAEAFLNGYNRTVTCKSQTTGQGNLQGEATGVATFEFHGCVLLGYYPCHSSGASSETIVTEPLAIDLVKLEKEDPEEELYPPGLALVPLSNQEVIAEFTCASGGVNGSWTGEVIGAVKHPQYGGGAANTLTADFMSGARTYDGRETELFYRNQGGQQSATANISASNFNLTLELGAEVELSTEEGGQHPEVVVAGGFPAAVSVATLPFEGFDAVLRQSGGGRTVTCKGATEAAAVTGSGEFDDLNSGQLMLTLHNCRENTFNATCTSSGQPAGTVVTESLPVHLAYLSDGKPGIVVEANQGSGKVAKMSCISGIVNIEVTGGVLGRVGNPALGEASFGLLLDMAAAKQGEEYVQEYTETAGGEAVSLFETTNGGKAKSASLELPGPLLTFGGPVMLAE
jgi:hypothetical protein